MAFQVTISFAAVVTKVTRIPDRINIMHIRFVPFQTISGRCRLLTPWHIAYEDFFFRSRYTKLFSPTQQRFLGRHPLLWELYETHNRNTPRSARNTETSLLLFSTRKYLDSNDSIMNILVGVTSTKGGYHVPFIPFIVRSVGAFNLWSSTNVHNLQDWRVLDKYQGKVIKNTII